MSIQERMQQAEERYNELARQKEDITTEMNKLQGEYRVLGQLLQEEAEKPKKKSTKEATVIDAVPEVES